MFDSVTLGSVEPTFNLCKSAVGKLALFVVDKFGRLDPNVFGYPDWEREDPKSKALISSWNFMLKKTIYRGDQRFSFIVK